MIGFLRKNLLYPLILWRGGELERLRYLSRFEESQYWNPDEIHSCQAEKLERLLAFASQQSPFYRQRIGECDAIRQLEDPFAALKQIPPTEKTDIQQHAFEMIADGLEVDSLIRNQTGGSTGEPIRFYLDRSRYEARVAAMNRHDKWAGFDIGRRAAYVWGVPQDRPSNGWKAKLRNRLLGGQLWLDTSNVTDRKLRDFNEQLKRFRPHTIIAYANAITLLARFCEEHNLSTFQPHSVITSAELLTDESRALVERVFGCRVFNRYGCREFSVVASECDQHDGLHLMAEGLLVEIDEATRSEDGSGDLLVTDLLNFAMPMIRYRIGDRGQLLEGRCVCGRGLPRLKAVDGRTTDFVVARDGRLVSGVFLATYVVAQRKSLGQVQIRQEAPGQILYRVKPSPEFDPTQDFPYLERTTKRYLGEDAVVDFEIVDEIPRSTSGKLQFSISTATPDYAKSC